MKLELSRGILKNFAQITNDSSNNKTSTSVHATAVVVDGVKYAKIDGSNVLTPISETTDVQTGDRILVTIENHKAVVIGNFTYPPSARNEQKALEESERASSTANLAIEKAGQAQSLVSEANTLSSQATASASQAISAAQQASTLAQNAQTAASEANTKSDSALASASESLTKSNAAQKELDALKAEVKTVQGDVADARAEAIASVDAVKEELSANYAKKTEVTAVEGSLKAEITKSVSELQSTISEQYTAKSESVALEERLQSRITQNADRISSVVSRTTKLETDTSEAQKQIDAAKASAANAQSTADAAQAAAKTAQDSADAAQSAADTAQTNAATAQSTADAAKARAEAANTAAANAQSDLDAAKANLNEVTNRVGATEEEIAAAQQAVNDAQAAADQAITNAASANTAAANAQTAADKAKTDAANAQSAANTAQTKADSASAAAATAQAAADKAQADADALKSRVTTCETNISQNAEAIALRATKTELTDAVDGIQVGGRNLFLKTREFDNYSGSYNKTSETYKGFTVRGGTISNAFNAICEYTLTGFNLGDTYTLSFYAKGNLSQLHAFFHGDSGYVGAAPIAGNGDTPSKHFTDGNYTFYAVTSEWKRYWVTWKLANTGDISIDKRVLLRSDGSTSGQEVYICGIMFEKSSKPSDWSPAPEDQDAATQAVADNLASNYYNKTQTDAQIKVKADSILSTVSSTYQTKDAMGNYSTTAQMKTAIEQSATSIKSEVSATYATNAKVDGIQVGGRNLYYTKTIGRGLGVANCSSATVQNGEIILVASGSDLYIGSVLHSGDVWNEYYSPLMSVDGASYVTFSVSNPLFRKNFYNFLDSNKKAISIYTYIGASNATLQVPNGAKYISMRFGYGSAVSGTTYKLKIKVEKGNKPTDWSPAPEDVDSSIGEVKTIAEQTSNQFKWIVKSGTSESNMVLTDTLYNLVAQNINLTGKVTFSCLDSAAQQKINTAQSTADTAKSNAATAQSTADSANSKIDGLQVGGRNLLLNSHKTAIEYTYPSSGYADWYSWRSSIPLNGGTYTLSFWAKSTVNGDEIRVHFYNPSNITSVKGSQGQSSAAGDGQCDFVLTTTLTKYWVTYTIPKGGNSTRNVIIPRLWSGSGSGTITVQWEKLEEGNKATDWTPAPEDTDSAISTVDTKIMNWCYNNDVTYINGGKIYTGTVTADKISVTSLEAICAKIGGFTIGSSALYNNTTALAGAANSVYLGTDGISCGTTFKVTKAGAVTATSGKIGKYDITSTYLMTGSGSTATGIGGDQAFWAGNGDSNSAPFRVSYKGQLYAKDMIASNQLYIYDEKNSTTMPFAYADGGVIFNGVAYAFNGTVTFNNGFILDNDSSISGHVIPSISNTYNIGGANNEFNYTCSRIVRIGLADYSESKAVIDTKWKDGNTHNILTRGTDGLTSAIGWVGSSSYATVLKLNSRTVQVVNSSGTSTLSDGRLKKDFRNLEAWEQFYLDLKPIAYKYKDGSSGRNHMGFVAQQVEEALLNNGLTTNDFAGLVKYDVNPDDEDSWHGYKTEYGLIYTEFTALNTYMTQKNAKAVRDLSHRFAVLDGKVNSTYARMASAGERIDKLEKENKQLREEIAQLKMAS